MLNARFRAAVRSRPAFSTLRPAQRPFPIHRQFSTSRPYSSHTSSTKSNSSRVQRYLYRTAYLSFGFGALYLADREWNASAIARNFRTLWTCAMITLDYKFNFTEEKSDQIPELHERVAERVYDLFTKNGGLYIKIGQAFAANSSVLPKPMQAKLSRLFDDAPQIPYSQVDYVFRSEFGRPPSGPDGVFEVFEEEAVASASIAQVHRAKLWPQPGEKEGKWVAVKIQKPDVAKQMEWDLGAYRMVMWMFEHWAFDLPVYFVVDFVSDHLRRELDFLLEAQNAKTTAAFVASEPRLRDSVHIPNVYDEYTTKRVMTAEWIDGVRLSDRDGVLKLMGERRSFATPEVVPSIVASPPLPQDSEPGLVNPVLSPTSALSSGLTPSEIPPPTKFNFPSKPLRGGIQSIMQTMVELFSAQMFNWGYIHCDPHPGNIIIRPNPSSPSKPQLVLLDHGLYVRVDEEFKKDWAGMWKALLIADFGQVARTTKKWGVGLPDLFASVALARPTRLTRRHKNNKQREEDEKRMKKQLEEWAKMSQYEQSVRMKQKLKEFLTDTDRMPKVLIFLLRNMRIVQGNNQSFGSPVNRIKITGLWASRALSENRSLTLSQRIHEYIQHLRFLFFMFSLDMAFWYTQWKISYLEKMERWIGRWIGWKGRPLSFEEELERSMRGMMQGGLGIKVDDNLFNG
ncbi:ABC1-domain-containing protein [Dendrothele bispora CBS 962.96]|uniref:ABC1-domain-containing protein n=1 Tax=Dendrothele bispora (strain CBS 962.96) TaxID=1314807 RepID=A0A4S8MVJ1_DENBC|nr:ABC1-domain-containing protein [Dendrothele bispora CBS 962.96]